MRVALAAAFAAAAAALSLPASSGAAGPFPACSPDCTITVDSTVDEPDANPGDGKCATTAGDCTLRAAIQEANADRNKPPFQSLILVPPGHYTLTRHGIDDTGDRGDLDMYFFGQVIGAGQSRTVVDGDGADRVFDLHHDSERVAHLAVTNGRATDGPGGGIRHTYIDYLEYLYVTDNVAVPTDAPDSGFGGGIAGPDSSLDFVTLAYNSAANGGGIWFDGAQSGFGYDALVHNHATGDGGGMYWDGTDAYFHNTTISGNTAGGHGGGLFIDKPTDFWPLTMAALTITSNTAPEGAGGGLWRGATGDSERMLAGSIVADNGGGDCAGPGTLSDRGGNIDSDGSCGFTADSDHSGVEPLLGPVAYNGGPTPTRVPQAGSPAIDTWDCTAGNENGSYTLDQRGAPRPQGARCDAGAVETGPQCCPSYEAAYKPGSAYNPRTGPKVSYCGQIIEGTNGADTMIGDRRRNELHGRGGDDRIFGKADADCLYGGRGNDFISGGRGHDTILGGSGNDELRGGRQEDFILGGSGNDRIFGGSDDDRLYGGPGNDYIKGGNGYDTISAGPGNDRIDATGTGFDKVDCGSGDDHVRAKRTDQLYNCEHVRYVG